MAKHSVIDIKKTKNDITPISGFKRLKVGEDDNLYYINDNGTKELITSPLQLPVISSTINDPSTITPNLWDRYIVPKNAINDWAGHGGEIAQWNGTNWEFFIPKEGWIVYDIEKKRYKTNLINEWVFTNKSLALSNPVRAIETSLNIDLNGTSFIIDGYVPQKGDWIALAAQINPIENGIYVYDGINLVRPPEFSKGDHVGGTFFSVTSGAKNYGSLWIFNNIYPNDVVDVDSLSLQQIASTRITEIPKIRLMETFVNVDINNLPPNFVVDSTAVRDGDIIGLFAQSDFRENGFWVVVGDHLERSPLLLEGEKVFGKMFLVTDGCRYGDTLQIFTNGVGEDIVGTHNIQRKGAGESEYEETYEKFDVNDVIQSNQFIDLANVPEYQHFHLLVYLNGILLTRGENSFDNDYYVDQNRIYFNLYISQGDRITVFYTYKTGDICLPPPSNSKALEFDVTIETANTEFSIFKVETNTDFQIDWGDGTVDNIVGSMYNYTLKHIYTQTGTYRIKILGHTGFQLAGSIDAPNKDFLITLKHWGDLSVYTTMDKMWAFLQRFSILTDDIFNPPNPISIQGMFQNCTNFNSNISNFITTNVTNMSYLFYQVANFNQDLINWNTSNVTDMSYMFYGATNFSGTGLGSWNVSSVTDMQYMFYDADNFREDIGNWDTSNVLNMTSMFENNDAFNKDISGWNVSNVTDCANFRKNAALNCENTPPLKPACTECYNPTKFKVTVTDNDTIAMNWGNGNYAPSVKIDWGDGTVDNFNGINGQVTHTYQTGGTYTIRVQGHSYLNLIFGDRPVEFLHWGYNQGYVKTDNMFANLTNLTFNVDDTLTPANDNFTMVNMFSGCTNWDGTGVESIFVNDKVVSLAGCFINCNTFNKDLSHWNTVNNTSLRYTFQNCSSWDGQGLLNWNTSNVTNWEGTFLGCPLNQTNLTNLNLSSGSNFYRTFEGQQGLIDIDVSSWGVSANATKLDRMFTSCTNFIGNGLESWDVSSVLTALQTFLACSSFNNNNINQWNLASATDLSNMFNGCSGWQANIDGWTFPNVVKADSMFKGTTNAITFRNIVFQQPVDASNMFSTSGWNGDGLETFTITPTKTYGMFYNCSNLDLTNVDLSNIDMSQCTNMAYMFYGCINFNGNITQWDVSQNTTLFQTFMYCRKLNQDLSNWNVLNVTDMTRTFRDCYLIEFDFSTWDVSNVQSFNNTFGFCTSLTGQGFENWDVSSATTMYQMFFGANNFNGNITNWNVSKVENFQSMFQAYGSNWMVFNRSINWDISSATNTSWMFRGCSQLNQPIILNNGNNVIDCQAMFADCHSFDQDVSTISSVVTNSTTLYAMFYKCYNFTGQGIETFNTSNVIDMHDCFYECQNFNGNIAGWNTSKVTTMSRMFWDCRVFNQDISSWDVSNVESLASTFYNCFQFNQPIGNWNVSRVTTLRETFRNALVFNQPLGNWNVSNVTTLNSTFYNAQAFDQDLSTWNISNVTNMDHCFDQAIAFGTNGDPGISNWDTSNVTTMQYTMARLQNFDYDISMWNVSNVIACINFRYNSSLSCANTPALPSTCTNGC